MKKGAWIVLLAVAGACESPGGPESPSNEPAGPIPVVAGSWFGRVRETSCTSECCLPSCSYRFKGGYPEWDFRLTLTQQGPAITGRFEQVPRPGISTQTGQVLGRLLPPDLLELAGVLTWQNETFPDVAGASELRQFNAVVDALGTNMRGGFLMVELRQDGREFVRVQCEIVRLDRHAP